MRLPINRENWTGDHAEKAIQAAWKAYAYYEKHLDTSKPIEVQNDLYRPYVLAKEQALDVANHTRWKINEAENLP